MTRDIHLQVGLVNLAVGVVALVVAVAGVVVATHPLSLMTTVTSNQETAAQNSPISNRSSDGGNVSSNTSSADPPPNTQITRGGTLPLDQQWAYVCTGDLTFRMNGQEVVGWDNNENTGLATAISSGESVTVIAPSGGSCVGAVPSSVDSILAGAVAAMRAHGCLTGCASVEVQRL